MSRATRQRAFDVVERVRAAIREQRLLRRGETVVVAVSGGPDSMALLDLLTRLRDEWQVRLHVAHLNHQLRGAAADADEAFVRAECQRARLPCTVRQTHVAEVAHERGLSEETAARQARYEFLQEVAGQIGAGAIAVGHTCDDQAETVLMRLLRGAGAEGLCGIRPARPLGRYRLVRPLLTLWRHEIERYLRSRRHRWRVDASNRDPRYLRNRIRHVLLPLLEQEYQPRLREVLFRTAEALQADYAFIEAWGKRRWRRLSAVEPSCAAPTRVRFDGARLRREPPAMQRYLLRRAVECLAGDLRRVTYQHWAELEALAHARPGASVVALPRRLRAVKRAGVIWIERSGEE